MKNSALIIFSTILISGCTLDNASKVKPDYYFDLELFFKAEAKKLNKSNNIIHKTVTHNGITELKKLQIKNWEDELALFIQSDINKPAWEEAYQIDSSKTDIITYKAIEDDLKTRLIEVKFKKGKPSQIKILNKSSNYLYQTKEMLAYYPDSLYSIKKEQKVTILGENNYQIEGKLISF